jgi:apolipoprotein N-acyltransferase
MPSLRYQLLSSPLCAFLGFLLLRHYVRICHDEISSLSECGVLYTGVEASRQLVMMQPWPPPLPAEAHTSADYPPRRTAAPLSGTLAVSFLHVFLAVRQLSYGIREEYDFCVEWHHTGC